MNAPSVRYLTSSFCHADWCVGVVQLAAAVALVDTKLGDRSPRVILGEDAWQGFADAARAGRFVPGRDTVCVKVRQCEDGVEVTFCDDASCETAPCAGGRCGCTEHVLCFDCGEWTRFLSGVIAGQFSREALPVS